MRNTTSRVITGLVTVTLAFAATSCGDDEPGADSGGTSAGSTSGTESSGSPATTASGGTAASTGLTPSGDFKPLKVALVMPSTAEDFGISRGIVRAMDVLQEERGGEENFELAYSENMFVVDDAAAAIRDYASRGFDVVVAPSSAYGSSIEEIAPDFPDVSFIWGTNPDTLDQPNVFAFAARSEQAGYVGGVVAGSLGETVGFVGPIYVGSIAGSVDGYKAGVAATNEGANVLENFTNSFSDATLASAAASTMTRSGATVLASQTEMGAGVASVAENSDGEVGFIGFDADFAPAAPSATILSLDFRYEVALREAFTQIDQGTLGGEIYWIDFANDGIKLVWNDGYELDPEIRSAAEDAEAKIESGELDVPAIVEENS